MLDTNRYTYPNTHDDIKAKLKRLDQSIGKLEKNLITPQLQQAHHKTALDPTLTIDYASELNSSQLLAATTVDGKILVIAGAGSGKTKTLTYRTSYLLENGVDPKSILLLTFTKKASNEIKGRAKALLAATFDNDRVANGSHINDVISGTFHSFCTRLLRQYSGLLDINPRFTILDVPDSEDAIDMICKEQKYPIKTNRQAFPRKATLQKIISTCRNRHLHIRHLIESDYPDLSVHIAIIEQIAIDYHKYKRANYLYDFDDIISQVVHHLKTNQRFKRVLQETFRYIMVDEYQDTNIPQKQLIDLICEPDDVSLMVVGDDNQSIYAFRGANYENILLFGETYPQAKLIKLEQNYRSTPAILDYINALSAQITLGYQKQLYSDAPIQGHKPSFTHRSNETKEAKFIAGKIVELKMAHDYRDFAVLCRTSYLTSYIQIEFMERNIPFIVVGGIKFVERRHVKDVLAFVKVLYNPSDTISWHRILTLFKGIGSVTATKLTHAINANDRTMEPLLDAKLVKKNEKIAQLYHMLIEAGEADSVQATIDIILAFYTPLLKLLEENWRERAEDFRVIQNLAREHTGLDEFLENLALNPPDDSIATFAKPEGKDKDMVTISTIHSAKGLEWPIVFVNALVDGMMPHHRSLDDFEELEGERKLFYVACSRAKTHLYLTAPNYFSSYSGYFDKVSRFISEVLRQVIDVSDNNRKGRGKPRPSDVPEWW